MKKAQEARGCQDGTGNVKNFWKESKTWFLVVFLLSNVNEAICASLFLTVSQTSEPSIAVQNSGVFRRTVASLDLVLSSPFQNVRQCFSISSDDEMFFFV